MTIEEAIRRIEMAVSGFIIAAEFDAKEHGLFNVAREMAITALRAQQQRKQLWHDAQTDPPPQNGLYYGAKDDTNSMWAVQYLDGIWTLNACHEQQMDIVRWAFYGAFCSDDEHEAEKNDPLTYEELQKMGGEPVWLSAKHMEPCWDIVSIDNDHDYPIVYFRYKRKGAFWRSECGKTWLAYRRPPGKEA